MPSTSTLLFTVSAAILACAYALEGEALNSHCTQICAAKIRPADPDELEYLRAEQLKACQTLFARNPNLGQTCRNSFESVAETSCILGCTLMQSGNPVHNNPRVATHRGTCEKFRSRNPYPALYNACQSGIVGGVELYARLGKDARAAGDSLNPRGKIVTLEQETVIEVEGGNKASVEEMVQRIQQADHAQEQQIEEETFGQEPEALPRSSKGLRDYQDPTAQVRKFLQKSFFPKGLRNSFKEEQ